MAAAKGEPAKIESSEGQVIPDEARPSKGEKLYFHPGFNAPHMLPHTTEAVDGRGGEDLSGPYMPVVGWPKPVEKGWRMAGGASVLPESADRILALTHYGMERERVTPIVWGKDLFTMLDGPYATTGKVETRPENHFMVFNREGDLVESWTWQEHLFKKLNRVFISPYDPDKHVWVTDSNTQSIYKFSHDGKELVMRIGEVEAGSSPIAPWKAQDLAWLPNGDFYAVGLARVDKFDKDGKHLYAIENPGSGPGQFSDLHGLILDFEYHRIYLADRGNSRIQVFDEEWNFLQEWPNILAPYCLRMTDDGYVWVSDGFTQRFLKYDRDGKLLLSWGQFGIAPGCTWGIHHFETDEEGNLYIAEDYGCRIQKYVRRPDVDAEDPPLDWAPDALLSSSGQLNYG